MADRATICAFCAGTGRDPFGLLSELSTCQVCLGKGFVTVRKPAVRCAFCAGSGVQPYQRLTCSACGGRGIITVIDEVGETCARCHGTGAEAPDLDFLPCVRCRGAGVVPVKEKVKVGAIRESPLRPGD